MLESVRVNPETPAVHWKKVTLVGVGLLGGSLGLALKQRRLARAVVGYVRRPASVQETQQAGAVDLATCSLGEAVRGADLIIFCTPVGQMEAIARQMVPHLKRGAVVTDVGSVKGTVVANLERLFASAGAHFVASHPMAGSEKTGVGAARRDLYVNAVCVLTPTPRSHPASVRKITRLWENLGSRVVTLTPEAHDQMVSRSSHLPHLVAASLASFVLGPGQPEMQAMLCANGFRDTTRIASGSPEMWRDIALNNRKHISRALGKFVRNLEGLRLRIRKGDSRWLERFLSEAKSRRDNWRSLGVPRSPE